jgi:hypothetical protein
VVVRHSRLRLRRVRMAAVAAAAVLVLAALFAVYLRLALISNTNADAAGNSLQAWDMLHGNVLLAGWTVSDVPFYTVELVEFALIELVTGLRPDTSMVAAAANYTMIVALVMLLARGRLPGPVAWLRIGIAASFVLVPPPRSGHLLLAQPDHTATVIPLLVACLLIDRVTTDRVTTGRVTTGRVTTGRVTTDRATTDRHDGSTRPAGRWLPVAVAAVLAWGQLSDPLLTLIAAVPLALVSAIRLITAKRWRPREWRCLDGTLLIAAIGSVVIARAAAWSIVQLGGYMTQPVPSGVISVGQLGQYLARTGSAVAVLLGCYFPQLQTAPERALGLVHVAGVALFIFAAVLVLSRWARGRAQRVEQLLLVGIVTNLGTYTVSALNSGVAGSREIAPVLPMAAVLVVSPFVRRSTAAPSLVGVSSAWRRRVPALAVSMAAMVVAVVLATALVGQLSGPVNRPVGQDMADWLSAQHLEYGLGSYWTASTVTVATGGTIEVAPITSHGGQIQSDAWESRRNWYDAKHHDARFVVIDLQTAGFAMVTNAIAQFGAPVQQVLQATAGGARVAILIYDHNVLTGLPA